MDPKTFAKLDPKLRETYERVMGTSVPQKPLAPPAAPSKPPVVPAPTTASVQPINTSPTATVKTPQAPSQTMPIDNPSSSSTLIPHSSDTPSQHAVQPNDSGEKSSMHNTIAVHTAVSSPTHTEEKKIEVHEPDNGVPAWKKILFIVLGIAFFSAYAVFWLIYFKVQLPF